MPGPETTDHEDQQWAKRRRRQQRRRAIIAWSTAALVVVLVALGAIFGGESKTEEVFVHPDPFGYTMTSAQYKGLEKGLDQSAFVDRLEKTGLPENLTQDEYVALFPPHEDDVTCSFWEISDRPGVLARICFDDDGALVQKLERDVSQEPTGVSV